MSDHEDVIDQQADPQDGGTLAESDMKALVEYMAKGLVSDIAAVSVKELKGDGATIFELSVAGDDLGKVIGKKGRTARALRTILQAASAKHKTRSILEILD